MTAARSARSRRWASGKSSAQSTTSCALPGAPASISLSSRCRSRPRAASWKCSRSSGCCRSTSASRPLPNKLRFRPRAYSYIVRVQVSDIIDKPITDWDVVMKWLFDKIVGSVILLLAFPFMLLTALAIKLDSKGPVFFKQKRYGFNNELIEVYKFRSMHVDQCDPTPAKLVQRGDPRVTRVGAFIRKTSLDELPQLINVVFKGNLSLVGPRPHAVHAKAENRLYDEAVDGYFARHRVKPGITGWA